MPKKLKRFIDIIKRSLSFQASQSDDQTRRHDRPNTRHGKAPPPPHGVLRNRLRIGYLFYVFTPRLAFVATAKKGWLHRRFDMDNRSQPPTHLVGLPPEFFPKRLVLPTLHTTYSRSTPLGFSGAPMGILCTLPPGKWFERSDNKLLDWNSRCRL